MFVEQPPQDSRSAPRTETRPPRQKNPQKGQQPDIKRGQQMPFPKKFPRTIELTGDLTTRLTLSLALTVRLYRSVNPNGIDLVIAEVESIQESVHGDSEEQAIDRLRLHLAELYHTLNDSQHLLGAAQERTRLTLNGYIAVKQRTAPPAPPAPEAAQTAAPAGESEKKKSSAGALWIIALLLIAGGGGGYWGFLEYMIVIEANRAYAANYVAVQRHVKNMEATQAAYHSEIAASHAAYENLRGKHNSLVGEFNVLAGDYNQLHEEYNTLTNSFNSMVGYRSGTSSQGRHTTRVTTYKGAEVDITVEGFNNNQKRFWELRDAINGLEGLLNKPYPTPAVTMSAVHAFQEDNSICGVHSRQWQTTYSGHYHIMPSHIQVATNQDCSDTISGTIIHEAAHGFFTNKGSDFNHPDWTEEGLVEDLVFQLLPSDRQSTRCPYHRNLHELEQAMLGTNFAGECAYNLGTGLYRELRHHYGDTAFNRMAASLAIRRSGWESALEARDVHDIANIFARNDQAAAEIIGKWYYGNPNRH